jgi:hypothetical protein
MLQTTLSRLESPPFYDAHNIISSVLDVLHLLISDSQIFYDMLFSESLFQTTSPTKENARESQMRSDGGSSSYAPRRCQSISTADPRRLRIQCLSLEPARDYIDFLQAHPFRPSSMSRGLSSSPKPTPSLTTKMAFALAKMSRLTPMVRSTMMPLRLTPATRLPIPNTWITAPPSSYITKLHRNTFKAVRRMPSLIVLHVMPSLILLTRVPLLQTSLQARSSGLSQLLGLEVKVQCGKNLID